MQLNVVRADEGHRLRLGEGAASAGDVELVNEFLAHLGARRFSPATVRAYAYDLLNFLRFLVCRDAGLADVVPTDLFDYLDWQQRPGSTTGVRVARLADRAWRGPGVDEPAGRRGARAVRVRGDQRFPRGQPGPGGAPLDRAARETPRSARAHRSRPAEHRWAADPGVAPAAGVPGPGGDQRLPR